ncbi:MAG: prolyl oligopeptidase family serine peptidase [Sediminibacterium sp.]|nr:prolyl oligopeptidase family serine peptidase [Sediminibacterium sp.]
MLKFKLIILILLSSLSQSIQAQQDKYQWLENVDSPLALDFVNTQNKATLKILTNQKDYKSIYDKSLEIYNSSEKIAYPTIHGKYVYNFWKDKNHERGIWRRCLLDDYTSGNIQWETLIDIDELSKKDNIKWVYKGASGLFPNYNKFLISLSNGGGDAIYIKEFDADQKEFIKNGFILDESKGGASYLDENTLIVSTDFGKGTMTTSGYPKQSKLWKRGSLIKDASLIYDGQNADVGDWGGVLRDDLKSYIFINRAITFFTSQYLIWMDNKIITLDLPEDCTLNGILHNQLIVQLKSDWTVNTNTYKIGTLLSLNFTELLKGNKEIQVIIEPDTFSSISEISTTKNNLLVNLLNNVISQLHIYSFNNGKWSSKKVAAPDYGNISIISTDEFSDQYFFDFQNFITPTTLYAADASLNSAKPIKSLPAFFDGSKYEVFQFKATSKDGTLIPYFVVSPKGMKKDGNNPTLIEAYGGFEVSYQPYYLSTTGFAWLEKGGVCVIANLRGGGEYGPKWHHAGMKEKRQNVFDDLYAVSEDVIVKKITSSKHLGILGGSNGGLLVGVAFTQRPELYNAVVCEVPLLDMKRYNKLLAGASWMDEYGNPDISEEWEYIKKYSPYQNVKMGINYPEVFFTTSTRDDRVHPGHARKMVAKMIDLGYKIFYYENTEGGHAGSSTNEQRAKEKALIFSYLLMKLK